MSKEIIAVNNGEIYMDMHDVALGDIPRYYYGVQNPKTHTVIGITNDKAKALESQYRLYSEQGIYTIIIEIDLLTQF